MLTDAPLLRYNRQILMHDFDIAAQERLQQSRALVVGLVTMPLVGHSTWYAYRDIVAPEDDDQGTAATP